MGVRATVVGKEMNENLIEKTVQDALRNFDQRSRERGGRSQFNQLYHRIVHSGDIGQNLTAQHRHSLNHKWESGSSLNLPHITSSSVF